MKYIKNDEAVSPVLGVILMVAITVIVATIIAVFMFGVGEPDEAPQAKLKFVANATTLTITHGGGDPLVLKDNLITIINAVDDSTVQGANGVPLSDLTTPDTLVPGGKIQCTNGTTPFALAANGIYRVQIMHDPSGQFIANTEVVVR